MLLFWILSTKTYYYIVESLYIIIASFQLNNCCGKIQPVQQYNYLQSPDRVRQCAPPSCCYYKDRAVKNSLNLLDLLTRRLNKILDYPDIKALSDTFHIDLFFLNLQLQASNLKGYYCMR